MSLLSLLDQIKNAIYQDPTTPHKPGHDPGGLIGGIESLFGKYGDQNGDPGDQGGQFGDVRPASRDPLGDPGVSDRGGRNGNVRPASEDPLGDPG